MGASIRISRSRSRKNEFKFKGKKHFLFVSFQISKNGPHLRHQHVWLILRRRLNLGLLGVTRIDICDRLIRKGLLRSTGDRLCAPPSCCLPIVEESRLCDPPTTGCWLHIPKNLLALLKVKEAKVRDGTHGQILLRACTVYISEPNKLGSLPESSRTNPTPGNFVFHTII